MPFAGKTANIPCFGQDFGERTEFGDRRVSFRSSLGGLRDIGMHAMLRRKQARQKCRATRRTNRIIAEGTGKQSPLGGELINMRRPDVFIAVAPKSPRPMVISKNENDIRRTGFCTSNTQRANCQGK